MSHRALIIGASGIVGSISRTSLLSTGWSVLGYRADARRRAGGASRLPPISRRPNPSARATAGTTFSHVFFTAWSRQATEKENIRVNGAMVRHVLDALGRQARSSNMRRW